MIEENMVGVVSLFLGSSFVLYVVTKPKREFDDNDDDSNHSVSFKGAMKYSPAAMRQRNTIDEMHM
jgi:hypothetical protein